MNPGIAALLALFLFGFAGVMLLLGQVIPAKSLDQLGRVALVFGAVILALAVVSAILP